jgi:chromosome partitioning protein
VTRIIAVANQKGGVGKTTTTLNLGMALVQKQQRVLFLDLDPQSSLTNFLTIDPYRVERSTYSLLMYPEMTLSRILKTLSSSLALVPGSVDLATAAIKIVQEGHPLDRLHTALRSSRVNFDYVLIDTPPGLNVLTVIGLLAADEVLIPSQCNHSAILSIRAMLDVTKRIRDNMGNSSLKLRGILPTFFDSNALFSRQVLTELHALLPEQLLQTIIPYDTNVADAPHKGKTVVEDAPESPGAVAYKQLSEEILAN